MNKLLIQIPKAEISRTGLSMPDGLEVKEWAEIGKSLCLTQEGLNWCIGDWINYGEKEYGEKYSEALSFFGKEVLGGLGCEIQTLRVYAYVANHVKPLTRINNLSWNHHRVVAPMEAKEQAEWLAKARENSWPVGTLRAEIRQANGEIKEHNETPAFNTSTWGLDGVRGYKGMIRENPLSQWDASRLQLVYKDLEPVAWILTDVAEEMRKRGLLNESK